MSNGAARFWAKNILCNIIVGDIIGFVSIAQVISVLLPWYGCARNTVERSSERLDRLLSQIIKLSVATTIYYTGNLLNSLQSPLECAMIKVLCSTFTL